MSILDAIVLISGAYRYCKDTYRALQQNEDDVRDLLDEIFLYESLVDIYSKQVSSLPNPAESPYARAIKMFSDGICGVQGLMVNYTMSKSMIKKAWTFCKQWCCTSENALKIKKFTAALTSSIQLLNFSGNVLILQKVDTIMMSQTQLQGRFCELLQRLNPETLRSFVVDAMKRTDT